MAGSCVDQNIIIGVFAGIGGALFIGLVLALICVCRKSKSDNELSVSEDGRSGISSSLLFRGKFDVSPAHQGIDNTTVDSTAQHKITADDSQKLPATNPSINTASPEDVNLTDAVPQGICESSAYRNFHAQLQNIDDFTPVVLSRPKLVSFRRTASYQDDGRYERYF